MMSTYFNSAIWLVFLRKYIGAPDSEMAKRMGGKKRGGGEGRVGGKGGRGNVLGGDVMKQMIERQTDR